MDLRLVRKKIMSKTQAKIETVRNTSEALSQIQNETRVTGQQTSDSIRDQVKNNS